MSKGSKRSEDPPQGLKAQAGLHHEEGCQSLDCALRRPFTLALLAQGTATELGFGWRCEGSQYEHMQGMLWKLLLDTDSGQKEIILRIWLNSNKIETVFVTAYCHGGPNGRQNYYLGNSDDLGRLEIKMSLAKTPKQAAADIKRRLFPAYAELWQKSYERKLSQEAYLAKVCKNMAELAGLLKVPVPETGQSVHLPGSKRGFYGDFAVQESTCSITLHSVPLAFASVIARLCGLQTK